MTLASLFWLFASSIWALSYFVRMLGTYYYFVPVRVPVLDDNKVDNFK
jgi:hypothetical protein